MNKQQTWKINNQIRAAEVRLIDAEGKQIGILSRDEALKKRKETGLDLIEIVSSTNPPIVKLIEFDKFRYKEEKKLREQKKKEGKSELKEVRFSPFIAEGDYQTRTKKVQRFLDENNKVRVVVVFKGRQLNSKKFGYELISRITEQFRDRIAVDMEPKFIGRHLATIISPIKGNKKEEKNDKN